MAGRSNIHRGMNSIVQALQIAAFVNNSLPMPYGALFWTGLENLEVDAVPLHITRLSSNQTIVQVDLDATSVVATVVCCFPQMAAQIYVKQHGGTWTNTELSA